MQARGTNELSIHIVLLTIVGTVLLIPNTLGTIFGPFEIDVRYQSVLTVILTTIAGYWSYQYAKRWKRRRGLTKVLWNEQETTKKNLKIDHKGTYHYE